MFLTKIKGPILRQAISQSKLSPNICRKGHAQALFPINRTQEERESKRLP